MQALARSIRQRAERRHRRADAKAEEAQIALGEDGGAREKEVIVEKAVITVGAAQTLFLGEGTRQEYGMIRFDGEPFDVSESYMRLMLEG